MGSMGDRYAAIRALYGDAVFNAIQRSKVLVVGAGGIGCELLKNLVLSGFINIEVVDLDTIDVSNLNRQFLFRRSHVGLSKALTAKDSVSAFNPEAQITAFHSNIKAPQFSSEYFSTFSIILNALDNIDARRHVNRMCLTSGTPLIESGTQGYSGQVVPILPHQTECYECNTIATPKTYAVCTIRSTPDKDVHCIVWGKYVYDALFGEDDEENVMRDVRNVMIRNNQLDDEHQSDDNEEKNADRVDIATEFTSRLFNLLFNININKQLENPETWKSRKAPIPLTLNSTSIPSFSSSSSTSTFHYSRKDDHRILSLSETISFLCQSIGHLYSTRFAEIGQLSFDKDDDVAMDIVSCLANLRMMNFHIPPLSRFAIKGIAGNIVHAIATTNAIAAGLIVMEAIKIIGKSNRNTESASSNVTKTTLPDSQQIYISPYKPHLLHSQPLEPPRTSCYICNQSIVHLYLNTNTATLRSLYTILTKHLAFIEPSIDIYNRDNAIGTIEDCESEYLDLLLSSGGVRANEGSLVRVEDEAQQMTITIEIKHKEWEKEEDNPDGFTLVGDKPAAETQHQLNNNHHDQHQNNTSSSSSSTSSLNNTTSNNSDDDLEIVEVADIWRPISGSLPSSSSISPQKPQVAQLSRSLKRAHSVETTPNKRARPLEAEEAEEHEMEIID